MVELQRRILLATLAILLATTPGLAATFGVPASAGAGVDGWFILVGKDAVDEAQSNFFGDIQRQLLLNIEVTGRALDVCFWDPGHHDPALGASQLDFEFAAGSTPSQMVFELYDPLGALLKIDDTTFGPDTAATDNARWCFYQSSVDGPVRAGTHQLIVRMVDGPGLDQQANVFGVETDPDYDAYVHVAPVGHSTHSGATLAADVVRLYPWIVRGSHGNDLSGRDGCSLEIDTFDGDAPVDGSFPPTGTIITRLAWSEDFEISSDGQLKPYEFFNLAPLYASDDHGIATLELTQTTGADGVYEINLSPPVPAMFDFNAFSFQIYDFGELSPSLFYPIVPPDPLMATYRSRRLYLPTASGPPVKEWIGHLIVSPPPSGAYFETVTSQVDGQVRIENPTVYDLTNVAGQTIINPSGDLTDPVNVAIVGGQGGAVNVTGKTIDFSFTRIRAGQTGVVSYSVDYTPSVVGFGYLTGDGTDFEGGVSPTWAMWDTPFATAEEGAPCMIQVESAAAPCTIGAAAIGPTSQVCQGEVFTLDGSSSNELSCPGGALEYRWSGPGIAAPAYSSDPTIAVSTTMAPTSSYTLDVRCLVDPGCMDQTTLDVSVSAGTQPVADAGGDRTAGGCDLPITVGTPGQVGFSYLWTSTFPIASLLDFADIAETSFIETVAGSYDLTLTVTSDLDPRCTDQITITVTITDGAPSGRIGNELRAVKSSGGADVDLSWMLGLVTPDRYNVNRGIVKTAIDKSALPSSYSAPIRNATAILVGTYVDPGAVTDATPMFVYEVWGRDCAGVSVIP